MRLTKRAETKHVGRHDSTIATALHTWKQCIGIVLRTRLTSARFGSVGRVVIKNDQIVLDEDCDIAIGLLTGATVVEGFLRCT